MRPPRYSLRRTKLACAALVALAAVGVARSAHAIQPLATFLAQANDANPDIRISRATAAERDAEFDRSTGALLPSLTAQGTYTRNQYEVSFPASALGALAPGGGTLVILPQNQLDANITVSLPILDIAAWDRRSAARATRDSAVADDASTRLDVARRVTRAYYQLVANEAVLVSAQQSLALSRKNETLVEDRRTGGTASELDVQRAKADIARAEQDVASAVLGVAVGRRSLESLTGIAPEPTTEFLRDELREESPLADWLGSTARLPAVESASASRRSAEASAKAATAAWLPTVTASAQERFTNAPSLTLHNEYYLLQASASWRLDATVPATVRAQRAASAAAVARADKVERDAEDALFQDWHQVRASIDKARAARAQVAAATLAASLARDRFQGGVATELDLLQAQQDLFRADVARIQADADLAYARASLRVDAARPLGERP